MEWLRSTMVAEGKISPHDLELFKVVDTPGEVLTAIKEKFIPECVRVPVVNGEDAVDGPPPK